MWNITELFTKGKTVIKNVCGDIIPVSIDLKINYTAYRPKRRTQGIMETKSGNINE